MVAKKPQIKEVLPPITEELLDEFRNVPATVEGILEFIDNHDDRHLRAFTKYMTPEQGKALKAAIKIIMREAPLY